MNSRSFAATLAWLALFPLVLSVPPASLAASTYYVSWSDGSDSNLGTSPTSPWKTLTRVSSATLAPGDVVSFKRGDIWYGRLDVNSSGSPNSPITLTAYGIGPRPVMSGTTLLTSAPYQWTPSSSQVNVYYVQKQGGGNPSLRTPIAMWISGAYLTKSTSQTMPNLQWDWSDRDNLGFNTIYLRNNSGNPETAGLTAESASQDRVIYIENKSYITITDIEAKYNNCTWCGVVEVRNSNHIILQALLIHEPVIYHALYVYMTTDSTVRESEVYGASSMATYSSAMMVESSDRNTINGNKIHGPSGSAGDGISIFASNDNVLESNEVYGDGTTPANGIYCRPDASRNIIRYNYIHDIRGPAVQIRERSDYNLVYYNLVIGHTGPAMQSDALNGSPGGATGNQFYNNTIFNTGDANGIHIFGPNDACVLKNNLVLCDSGDCLLIDMASAIGTTSDYNDFHKYGGTGPYIEYSGNNYPTLQAYQSASGKDPNSLSGDPSLIATIPQTATDLKLRPGSLLIGAGTAAPTEARDFFGAPVPLGDRRDIGAHQFQPATMPPRNLRILP